MLLKRTLQSEKTPDGKAPAGARCKDKSALVY